MSIYLWIHPNLYLRLHHDAILSWRRTRSVYHAPVWHYLTLKSNNTDFCGSKMTSFALEVDQDWSLVLHNVVIWPPHSSRTLFELLYSTWPSIFPRPPLLRLSVSITTVNPTQLSNINPLYLIWRVPTFRAAMRHLVFHLNFSQHQTI